MNFISGLKFFGFNFHRGLAVSSCPDHNIKTCQSESANCCIEGNAEKKCVNILLVTVI